MHRSIALASAVLLFTVACQGQAGTTTPPATEAAPTADTTSPVLPTPSPTAAVVLPGRLLFSRFDESTHTNRGSFTSLPDGSQETQVPLPWTEGLGSWSRSGTEITVVTQLADGRVGTAIVAPDGTVVRVLEIPDPTLNVACGIWSFDDARLTCECWDDTDASRNGLYSVRASDGGDLRRLSSPAEGATDFPGDYSSSGQFVFQRGSGDEGSGPLLLVDAEGDEPRQLGTGTYEDAGGFSPDGRLILTAGRGAIEILDLEGRVVETIADDDAYLFGAVWSPDGTHIAFSRTLSGSIADIWTSLPDGTERTQVTRTPANEINVDWGIGGQV